MATKILITDAYSPVGQAILRAFEHTHYSVLVPKTNGVDWEDVDAVYAYFDANAPDLVINTVGWAEYPSETDQQALVKAAEVLSAGCKKYVCTLIHLSSYQVFGGENKSSYDEQDRPAPIDQAGRAFWSAERAIEMQLEKYVHVRVGWLLDWEGDTLFRRTLVNLLDDRRFIASEYREGSPIGSAPLAKMIVSIVHQILCGAENWGVIHFSSGDHCSEEGLAEAIVGHLRDDHGISRSWWLPAEEPSDSMESNEAVSSVLTMRRCRDDFGVQARSWRQGLGGLVGQFLERRELEQKS